jgi:hypothetical protein
VTFAVTPSRVRFTVATRGLRVKTDTEARRSAIRGVVREFSYRSRRRLCELAWDLGELWRPELMVTLTMPGEWRSVCPDGRAFKRHVRAWQSRLRRYLSRVDVTRWSALWFLEFQRRGAPHLHLLLFGQDAHLVDVRRLRQWASRSWAEVVAHSDRGERRKHVKAGTRVERMRVDHFGYAVRYARKMQQKRVPDGFRSVGRFWGMWNHGTLRPAVWVETYTVDEVAALVRALGTVAHGRFGERLVRRYTEATRHSDTFTATVYGTPAVGLAVDPTTSGMASSGGGAPSLRSGSESGSGWQQAAP